MEVIQKLVDAILSGLDIVFMLAVNVLTFAIIKVVDSINGKKAVHPVLKVIIAVVSGSILAVLFYFDDKTQLRVLVYSFILSLVSWDYIFSPIIRKLKWGYTKKKKE